MFSILKLGRTLQTLNCKSCFLMSHCAIFIKLNIFLDKKEIFVTLYFKIVLSQKSIPKNQKITPGGCQLDLAKSRRTFRHSIFRHISCNYPLRNCSLPYLFLLLTTSYFCAMSTIPLLDCKWEAVVYSHYAD